MLLVQDAGHEQMLGTIVLSLVFGVLAALLPAHLYDELNSLDYLRIYP
jgi:hypothetical protein